MAAPADQIPRRMGDPNILSLLSLKLLLLAFFILLNALSHFEEDRARKVLESVNEAFNGRVEAVRSLTIQSAGIGNLRESVAVVRVAGELFQSMIPAVRVEVSARGKRVRLSLPATTLFRPGEEALQPGRGLLFGRLVHALEQERPLGPGYELELYHGLPGKSADQGDQSGSVELLALRRMGVLARFLEAKGLPDEVLSVGLLPGREDTVEIVVQVLDSGRQDHDYGGLAP